MVGVYIRIYPYFLCVNFVASYGVSASSTSSVRRQGSTSILGEEYIRAACL